MNFGRDQNLNNGGMVKNQILICVQNQTRFKSIGGLAGVGLTQL